MVRSLMAGLASLALFACMARADEGEKVKGKVQQYDTAQRILKVKIGEKEQTFKIRADTEFVDQNGKQLDEQSQTEQLAPGAQVMLVTQQQSGKQGPQQVSRVQIQVIKIKKKPGTQQQDEGGKTKPEQTPPSKPKTKPEQSAPQKQDDKPRQKSEDR